MNEKRTNKLISIIKSCVTMDQLWNCIKFLNWVDTKEETDRIAITLSDKSQRVKLPKQKE